MTVFLMMLLICSPLAGWLAYSAWPRGWRRAVIEALLAWFVLSGLLTAIVFGGGASS